jgi:hypothetical protein
MKTDLYRRHAAECLHSLAATTDPHGRLVLQIMAASRAKLAEQAEKNSRLDLVYETPAVVMQQEQQPHAKKEGKA